MYKKFNEEILKKHRSIPFWSWNDKLESKKLLKQIDFMKKSGIGGFFMHARSGLNTEYLSDEWHDCIKACADYAEKIGMEAWAYDENGWPSGFVGGKLLSEDENHDRYLTYTVGEYDKDALVSYLDEGDRLVRCDGTESGTYINVYEHLSSSTADILNPEVTDKFIANTHEDYKQRFGDSFSQKIKGFFTDEPQYYRWGTPYTVMIRKYFDEVLGEDILDGLGLLFFKKEGYREFRYKYWTGMQSLMLNNFAKKIYDWCDENGVKITGHYVEESGLAGQMMCCSGIMPFYEYEHIPGIDWLGRYCDSSISGRQVLSVARQLGKKQILGEIYACCGWDVTPRELKLLTEYLYIHGLNITCQHLLPYSERGNRIHDYPAHYSDINPWVKNNFKQFNDYFTELGALLAESEEKVSVAVLHPIRSAYFDFEHGEDDGASITGYGLMDMDIEFMSFIEKLERKNITYHFLDETLLAKYGSVEGKKIRCGKCEYEYLIIPPVTSTMDESTEKLLKAYVQNGGKVLLDGEKPSFITWKPYSYDYLTSNTSYEELEAVGGFKTAYKGGFVCVSPRNIDGKDFIFVINHSRTEDSVVTLDFGGSFTSLEQCRIGEETAKIIPLTFTLRAGESALLTPSNKAASPEPEYELIVPERRYSVVKSEPNCLTIDSVSYSSDGSNYCKAECVPMVFKKLLCDRYEGDLYLKYDFEIKELPEAVEFGVQMPRVKQIYVNGSSIGYNGSLDFESGNIAQYLKVGANSVVILLDYMQSENVYYVLFGENVTESLKNCLVYDSEIEPLILKGDFGVFEKNGFADGKNAGIKIGKDFYIATPKTDIDGLIEAGYPYFAGKITLKQQFNAKGGNTRLMLPGRWHIADVKINGTDAGKLFMDDMLDISDLVRPGENELEVELTIGNRNLYGPHHLDTEESVSVNPGEFEFNDKTSIKHFCETSAFVEPLY